jgi:hypothetical protein
MINDDYVAFAKANYKSPFFSDEDFLQDLNKIVVLKKLFRRFTTSGTINERLVLNNIIILMNVFGIEATNTMLFHKVEHEHWEIVKTFLIFLNSYVEEPVTKSIKTNETILAVLGDLRWHSRLQS